MNRTAAMTKITTLGIDPGIANTGMAIVVGDGVRYKLSEYEHVKNRRGSPNRRTPCYYRENYDSTQRETHP